LLINPSQQWAMTQPPQSGHGGINGTPLQLSQIICANTSNSDDHHARNFLAAVIGGAASRFANRFSARGAAGALAIWVMSSQAPKRSTSSPMLGARSRALRPSGPLLIKRRID
jgi:hypothetical protein